MARYKLIDRNPKFIPVVLDAQLMAGSFEYALDYLIDHELDLSRFDSHYKNDDTGAPAYAPAVLLKIVLLAYSRGMVSSRVIERACRENVLFMAISGDSSPQFTTIAKFVRELSTEINDVFTQVLLTCDAQGLIGRHMFAIDGVKLPSNASKHCSGTHAELAHDAERMEQAVSTLLQAHQARDNQSDAVNEDQERQADQRRINQYQNKTPVRQVSFLLKIQTSAVTYIERMKQAIDSALGRKLYGQRMGTVEPVFGNLRANKGLNRFTLRTQAKVNTQWHLYCLVHNIEKLAHHGYGGG